MQGSKERIRILINGYFHGGNTPIFIERGLQMGYDMRLTNTRTLEAAVEIKPLSDLIRPESILLPPYSAFLAIFLRVLRKLGFQKWEQVQVKRYRKALRKWKPDIIWNHQANAKTEIMLLTGYQPQVTSIFGSEVAGPALATPRIARILDASPNILTMTERMKKHLISQYPQHEAKIIPMPWGLPHIQLHKTISAQPKSEVRKHFGFGDDEIIIVDNRGLRQLDGGSLALIKAISMLGSAGKKIRLVLTTGFLEDQSVNEAAVRLAAEKGISDQVTIYHERLERERFFSLLHASDIYASLLPADQFGLAILEGAYHRNYLLLTNLEVYKEELGTNAYFVPHEDDKAISDAIASCIQNAPLEWLDANHSLVVESFDWERNAGNILDKLASIAHEHKSSRENG
jgi:glycosyltransferase involved in cell wall biosynthesis